MASCFIRTGYELAAGIGCDWVQSTNAVITANKWHHVAIVKKSTGVINASMFDLYVDGVAITNKSVIGGTRTQSIGTTAYLSVGGGFTGASSDLFTGSISKPKVWNVVLTAEEVAMDYALGRTGKALNVPDTAVCIGGIAPRAQLDVRGSARLDGKLAIGHYGSSDKEALAPLDVRGDFIQSTANGTVGTAARFGSSDGMLHVSSVKTGNGAETLALQTTIDNKTMDYNIENNWSYGTDARHALCLQPYKGRVGIGTTSADYNLTVAKRGKATNLMVVGISEGHMIIRHDQTSAGYEALIMDNAVSGSHWTNYIDFRRQGSAYGSIRGNGSNIYYNTSSDYRLKQNIILLSSAMSVINALKPVTYSFKSNPDETNYGFIAHEVSDAGCDFAVQGTKDEVEAIGNIVNADNEVIKENVIEPTTSEENETWEKTGERPVYQQLDVSKLIPHLTCAFQELYSELQAEKAKVADLLARVTALENA
jgi:hypothetical protein